MSDRNRHNYSSVIPAASAARMLASSHREVQSSLWDEANIQAAEAAGITLL